MSRLRRPVERGLTLIELMVVVVIVGVLMVSAAALVRGRPGLPASAHDIANHLRNASHRAVAGGVVDQAQVTGGVGNPPTNARSRIVIEYNATTDIQVVSVEVRDETLADSPVDAEWLEVTTTAVRRDTTIFGYLDQLVVDQTATGAGYGSGAGSGTGTLVIDELQGPHNPSAANATLEIYCTPDGSCDPITLFLMTLGTQEQRMRVVEMPLTGSPLIFRGW